MHLTFFTGPIPTKKVDDKGRASVVEGREPGNMHGWISGSHINLLSIFLQESLQGSMRMGHSILIGIKHAR